MKKFYLLTKTLLVATMLLAGASNAWADAELSAVSTATVWDFATLSFSKSTTEGQFLQDNTIYVGANVDRDGTNGRARFTGGKSSIVTELGENMIAIKTGAAGQLIMRISSYYGTIIVSDGTNTNTFASGSSYHGGSLSYLKAALDVEADKTYYIYTSNTDVKSSDNVGVYKLMYFPLENTTVAFSSTEEVTKTFTDYPRLNNGTENITYKGITYDNVYMGNGVKYNTVSGKERMLLGDATTGPLPTQNYISFKLPKGKGTLTIKASSYNATVKMSDGTNVLVESFTHGDPANVYNYESETETTLYYYATSYNTSQYTGIFYLTWTPTAHTYTINAVDGNGTTITELASAKCMEGDSYSMSGLPKVVKKDDKYYVLNDGTVTNFATQNYTMGTADETKEITYIEDASIVYFSEVENLGNADGTTAGNYSGGQYAAIKTGKGGSLGEIVAGNYQVEGNIISNSNRGLYLRTSTTNTEENVVNYIGNKTGVQTSAFTLAATSTLYLTGYTATSGSQVNRSADIDYIIIRSVSSVPVEVSAAGYATYVGAYDMNFSSTSIKAYKVKVESQGKATMTQVDNVPAGTPVLLYKAGGATEDIPTMTGAAAVTGNDLVAGTGAAVPTYETVSTENDYTNMILNNIDSKIGFYFANDNKVATNRAYLHIATSLAPDPELGARGMSLVIADEILTGINETEVATEAVQKEGKFVVDGKLVIFKKGMKFNANGARIY